MIRERKNNTAPVIKETDTPTDIGSVSPLLQYAAIYEAHEINTIPSTVDKEKTKNTEGNFIFFPV